MRWLLALVVSVLFLGFDFGQTQDSIRLEKVSYTELITRIKLENGKIVLVDFWGEFCLPCKKEFPHFVAIHRKYASKGVLCLSVSLDDPQQTDSEERVVEFLKKQQATCQNLLLSEDAKVWQEKLKIIGPPTVFLFSPDGKLINRWSDKEVDYSLIEKRILELLKNEK